MDINEFLNLLDGARKTGTDKYVARCPAHDDSDPSLSIGLGEHGKILVHCFSGCDQYSIVSAIGLKMSDLMPDNPYWQACKKPMRQEHIDPTELDKMVLEIAQADIRAGKTLSVNDRARVELAIRRLKDD